VPYTHCRVTPRSAILRANECRFEWGVLPRICIGRDTVATFRCWTRDSARRRRYVFSAPVAALQQVGYSSLHAPWFSRLWLKGRAETFFWTFDAREWKCEHRTNSGRAHALGDGMASALAVHRRERDEENEKLS